MPHGDPEPPTEEELVNDRFAARNELGMEEYQRVALVHTTDAQFFPHYPTHLLDGPAPDINAVSYFEAAMQMAAVLSAMNNREVFYRLPFNLWTGWTLHKKLIKTAMEDRAQVTQGISIFSNFNMGINAINVARRGFSSNPLMLVAFLYVFYAKFAGQKPLKWFRFDEEIPHIQVSNWAHSWAFLTGMGYELAANWIFSAT